MNAVHHKSVRMDWGTPQALADTLIERYGLTIDLAAHEGNHKLPRYLGRGGEHPNSLAVSWHGLKGWLNPPYGKEVVPFLAKACADRIHPDGWARDGALVVALIASRTDTRWWHDHVNQADEVFFVRGRIKFQGAVHCAPFPSAVVVWRPTVRRQPWRQPTYGAIDRDGRIL